MENILLPYFVEPGLNRDRKATDRAGPGGSPRDRAPAQAATEASSQGERQRVAICRAMVTSPRAALR